MSNQEALLPCSCGGIASLRKYDTQESALLLCLVGEKPPLFPLFIVVCSKCKDFVLNTNDATAIEVWNNRQEQHSKQRVIHG